MSVMIKYPLIQFGVIKTAVLISIFTAREKSIFG